MDREIKVYLIIKDKEIICLEIKHNSKIIFFKISNNSKEAYLTIFRQDNSKEINFNRQTSKITIICLVNNNNKCQQILHLEISNSQIWFSLNKIIYNKDKQDYLFKMVVKVILYTLISCIKTFIIFIMKIIKKRENYY